MSQFLWISWVPLAHKSTFTVNLKKKVSFIHTEVNLQLSSSWTLNELLIHKSWRQWKKMITQLFDISHYLPITINSISNGIEEETIILRPNQARVKSFLNVSLIDWHYVNQYGILSKVWNVSHCKMITFLTCFYFQGFFRRCITQGMTHKCSNEEKCEITPFTRNSCQYCRLKKCFAVGMSREGKLRQRYAWYSQSK